MTAKNEVVEVVEAVDMFNVTSCKLIKTKGTTLVGFVTVEKKGRYALLGAPCTGMPDEDAFLDLFHRISSNDAVRLDVAAENVDIMDLQVEQQVAFAGISAKYQVALANKDQIVAGMAIKAMLGK